MSSRRNVSITLGKGAHSRCRGSYTVAAALAREPTARLHERLVSLNRNSLFGVT